MKDYRWIKIPKYKDDPSKSWEERFKALDRHHVQETTFLIEMIERRSWVRRAILWIRRHLSK